MPPPSISEASATKMLSDALSRFRNLIDPRFWPLSPLECCPCAGPRGATGKEEGGFSLWRWRSHSLESGQAGEGPGGGGVKDCCWEEAFKPQLSGTWEGQPGPPPGVRILHPGAVSVPVTDRKSLVPGLGTQSHQPPPCLAQALEFAFCLFDEFLRYSRKKLIVVIPPSGH